MFTNSSAYVQTPRGAQPFPQTNNPELNLSDLPIEVIFKIFFELSQLDLKEASKLPIVCKNWQTKAHETPLYRLFIAKKFPEIQSACGDNFEKIFVFSNQMSQMANAYSSKNLNLLTYNSYKKQLMTLLKEYSDFLPLTPYFDLRPFGWLDRDSWIAAFNSVAPKLTKIEFLQAKGMGYDIYHAKVNMPNIPVLTKVSQEAKSVFKGIMNVSGVDTRVDASDKVNETLLYCITVAARVSKKLTTVSVFNTRLNSEERGWILTHFPNINLN